MGQGCGRVVDLCVLVELRGLLQEGEPGDYSQVAQGVYYQIVRHYGAQGEVGVHPSPLRYGPCPTLEHLP